MDTAKKWDAAAGDYQHTFKTCSNEYSDRLMAFFKDALRLRPGCRVIDIGCGVGKYGTRFAAMGCDVTLIDISANMLRHARENMAPFSAPRTVFQCDFDRVSPQEPVFQGGFDLAISTMSPAIHDLATVEKMSAMTHGWCFVSRFVSWSQPGRDRLYGELGLDSVQPIPNETLAAEAQSMADAVQKAGFTPFFRYEDYSWTDLREPLEAARRLLPEGSGQDALERAAAAAAKLAGDKGLFVDTVDTKVVWIYWNTALEAQAGLEITPGSAV